MPSDETTIVNTLVYFQVFFYVAIAYFSNKIDIVLNNALLFFKECYAIGTYPPLH